MDAVSFYVAGMHLTAVVLTAVAGCIAWCVRRREPLATGFAGVLWTGTWWGVFDLLQIIGPNTTARLAAVYLWLFAPVLLAIAFGLLVRLIVDNGWRPSGQLVSAVLGLVGLLGAGLLLPHARELVVPSWTTTSTGVFRWHPGPGYWGLIAVDCAAFAVLWLMLMHGLRHARTHQRRRVSLVLATAFLLAGGGLATLVQLARDQAATSQTVDLTVLGFVAVAGLVLWWLASTDAFLPIAGVRAVVLEGLDESILVLDRGGRVIDANQAARTLLGSPAPCGRPAAEVLARIGPDVVPQSGRYLVGRPVDGDESGEVDITCAPLRDDGEDVGSVVVIRDVTAQVRDRNRVVASNLALRDELRSLQLTRQEIDDAALVDQETGLANRRALLEVLDAVVAGGEIPVGVVRLDIDTPAREGAAGAAVPEEKVRTVATALTRCAPRSATIGRISPEGFAVVLPDGDVESARRYVEQVRGVLDLGAHGGCPIGAGVSAVAAGDPRIGRRPQAYVLLARAEDALADSLARGRGQVVIDRRR